MSSRSRSASPVREEPRPKKQKTGGFKWKESAKPKIDDGTIKPDTTLERGYRERDRPKPRDLPPPQDEQPPSRQERPSSEQQPSTTKSEDAGQRPDITSKFGTSYKPRQLPQDTATTLINSTTQSSETKEKKKRKPKSNIPNEPMIIVNINDRLGTKAAIPCLASDSVKAFKALVAAHIGRQPHEIMLKRQGERPFKDALTLADYGVSSGVQLDLELDTGD